MNVWEDLDFCELWTVVNWQNNKRTLVCLQNVPCLNYLLFDKYSDRPTFCVEFPRQSCVLVSECGVYECVSLYFYYI